MLLSHKADPNNKRMDGISALMPPCAGRIHAVVVELLLEAGANANACVYPLSAPSPTFSFVTMLCSTLNISAPLVPPLPLPPSLICRRGKDGLMALLLSNHSPHS